MPALGLANFDGMVPRTSPTALGAAQAQIADNVKLYSGELRYWRGSREDFTPASPDARSIYKHLNAAGDYRWLTWDFDTEVVTGPSADQTDMRLYYTGDLSPRKTNYAMSGLASPANYLEMGAPAPLTAPSVGVTGGSAAVADSRAYVVTFVSVFGALAEESAPSPASAILTVGIGQAAVLTAIPNPPAGRYAWASKRIYRTTSGSTGANYAYVGQVAVGVTTFTDDLGAGSLGAALLTVGWTAPVANLRGLVSMAGGVLAGFAGNTVYFCEPYLPHAWPIRYAVNVPYNVVALGAFGGSLVVLTELFPYVINGTVPGSMSVEKVPLEEPCVSRKSVAVDEMGAVYASPNGLVAIGPDTRGLVTGNLFRRDEWQKLTPSTMIGAIFENRYYGVYHALDGTDRCMVLSRDDKPALSFFNINAFATHVDGRNAKFFFLNAVNGVIYEADADDSNPYLYEWKSKRFVLPQAVSWSALKVDADYTAEQNVENYNARLSILLAANHAAWLAGDLLSTMNTTPLNGVTLNGSTLSVLPTLSASRSVQVFFYASGVPVVAQTMVSLDPVRLPAFRTRELEISIAGNTAVRSLKIATSVRELD